MKIFIFRNNHTYGPYSENSIRSFLDKNLLSKDDLACYGGKKDWINLGALLENLPPSKDESTEEFNIEDTIEKIKSLMENDEVEFALDLIKGLKNPEICCTLLQDCKIDQEGGWIELPDWMNEEKGFFLELLQRIPSDAESKLDPSIIPSNVKKIDISVNESMENLSNLEIFQSLESLEISSMHGLSNISSIESFEKLNVLKMRSCDQLDSMESISPIQNCKNLSELELNGFDFIEDLNFLSDHKNLTKLQVSSSKLTDLDGLKDLKSLRN